MLSGQGLVRRTGTPSDWPPRETRSNSPPFASRTDLPWPRSIAGEARFQKGDQVAENNATIDLVLAELSCLK